MLDRAKKYFATLGVANPDHLDLFVAMLGGLVDEAIDMFADHLGLPGSTRRKS